MGLIWRIWEGDEMLGCVRLLEATGGVGEVGRFHTKIKENKHGH